MTPALALVHHVRDVCVAPGHHRLLPCVRVRVQPYLAAVVLRQDPRGLLHHEVPLLALEVPKREEGAPQVHRVDLARAALDLELRQLLGHAPLDRPLVEFLGVGAVPVWAGRVPREHCHGKVFVGLEPAVLALQVDQVPHARARVPALGWEGEHDLEEVVVVREGEALDLARGEHLGGPGGLLQEHGWLDHIPEAEDCKHDGRTDDAVVVSLQGPVLHLVRLLDRELDVNGRHHELLLRIAIAVLAPAPLANIGDPKLRH
mmetsp:Transcript_6434/g.22131  ORF Transcript_6434/g.22131 Transcript_6434/m.22131 type:complete len:260 (-) Transcript_6434:1769-2548(-)